MSKKHFIALAKAIREHGANPFHRTPFTPDQLNTLADFLKSNWPNFDRQRWLDYINAE